MTIIHATSPSNWSIDSTDCHSKFQQGICEETDRQTLKFIWGAKDPEEPKQLWKQTQFYFISRFDIKLSRIVHFWLLNRQKRVNEKEYSTKNHM